MGNRVRLTNDTLNSYGYRVLTDGVDITQYERNPILLYMHNRGTATASSPTGWTSPSTSATPYSFTCTTGARPSGL